MPLVSATGLSHVRITVSNIARSRAFYEEVFGFEVAAQSPGDPGDAAVRHDPDRLYGGVVYQVGGMLFGLRPVASEKDRFDSERVGLDHVSFTVADRAALEAAAEELGRREIPHGEVRDLADFGMAILSVQDPDGINLELAAPL